MIIYRITVNIVCVDLGAVITNLHISTVCVFELGGQLGCHRGSQHVSL